MDHDQRFKLLLQEFFADFLTLFFPKVAARFDFQNIEWLEKELFTDPPQGDVLRPDLVAKLSHRPLGTVGEEAEETLALVHVEIESRESAAAVRKRMWEYYDGLRRKHQCKVLPIAVFLRVGLDGIGIEPYIEHFDDLEVLRFQYLYVGLPGLEAEQYVTCDNWLGVGLSALMRMPEGRQAWFRSEALRRILLECPENDYRKFLLCETVEAYLQLDGEQQSAFEQLLTTEPYKEIVPMMATTFEKGVAEGMAEGMATGIAKGQREAVRTQLEHRFGPLSPEVQQRLELWPAEKLQGLLIAVLDAPSLEALGLEKDES